MDGYALVNALLQKKSKTFEDYALLGVLPTVETYSSKYRRTAAEGRRALLIKANDTDILVIAVSTLPVLTELGLEKLWVAFGQGQRLKCIPVHDHYTYNGSRKD